MPTDASPESNDQSLGSNGTVMITSRYHWLVSSVRRKPSLRRHPYCVWVFRLTPRNGASALTNLGIAGVRFLPIAVACAVRAVIGASPGSFPSPHAQAVPVIF